MTEEAVLIRSPRAGKTARKRGEEKKFCPNHSIHAETIMLKGKKERECKIWLKKYISTKNGKDKDRMVDSVLYSHFMLSGEKQMNNKRSNN